MKVTKASESGAWASFVFDDGYELHFKLTPLRNTLEVTALTIFKGDTELADLKVLAATESTSSVVLGKDFTQKDAAKRWLAAIDYSENTKDLSDKTREALKSKRSANMLSLLADQKVRLGSL